MKNIFLFLVGISGAGKSSFTIEFLNKNRDFLRTSRDDIRKTLVGNLKDYYQRKDLQYIEEIVTKIEREIVFEALYYDKNIIMDNTNLKKGHLLEWIEYCEYNNISFKFKLFDIDLQEAKERVYFRDYEEMGWSDSWEHVKYIEKQYNQYQNIKKWIEQTYPDKILC